MAGLIFIYNHILDPRKFIMLIRIIQNYMGLITMTDTVIIFTMEIIHIMKIQVMIKMLLDK